MKRSIFGLSWCVLAIAVLGTGVTEVAAQEKPKLTKAVQKSLAGAQEAIKKKSFAECVAKVREAEAIAGRNDDDNFAISELGSYCLLQQRDYSNAARYLEQSVASGKLAADQLPAKVRALAQINYQNKNYSKAIEYGQRAIKGGYADGDMYVLVGQAHYLSGDNKGAYRLMSDYVGGIESRGGTPKEQSLLLIFSACQKMQDAKCVSNTLERLVAKYPKEEYWKNLMVSLFNAGGSDRQTLQLYRLAVEVNAMPSGDRFIEMAQLNIEQGFPGEAQTTIEAALAKNAFASKVDTDRAGRILASAKTLVATDKASLAKDAAAAKTGERLVRVGEAQLTYGMYAQAVESMSRGIAAGGLKAPADANLVLGIAQYRAGNKAEAIKTFNGVKGDDGLERLAKLWSLRAQN
jgi:tetratricopeptide (TPR) repeat protein